MDIRKELISGSLNDAISEIHLHNLPTSECMRIRREYGDITAAYLKDLLNLERLKEYLLKTTAMRRTILELLDKYDSKSKDVPTHEQFGLLLTDLHNAGMSDRCEEHFIYQWNMGYDRAHTLSEMRKELEVLAVEKAKRANEVLLHESVLSFKDSVEKDHWELLLNEKYAPEDIEYPKRMVACWNACKGIPTEDIGHWKEMYKSSADAAISSSKKYRNLVNTILPLIAKWDVSGGRVDCVLADFTEKQIRLISEEIDRIGLGGLLKQPTTKPLQKFYFTLGQSHHHVIINSENKVQHWTPGHVLVVEAENWDAARDLVFGKFGDSWSHQYSNLTEDMHHFLGGYIYPDMGWMKFNA